MIPPSILVHRTLTLVAPSVIAVSIFFRRRLQFASFLRGNNSGLTINRFVRLSALATCDLIISLPLALYYLISFSQHLTPWISFEYIHLEFGTVNQFNATYMAKNPDIATTLFLPRWLSPLAAIIFFAFFGLAEDALSDYLTGYSRLQSAFKTYVLRREPIA